MSKQEIINKWRESVLQTDTGITNRTLLALAKNISYFHNNDIRIVSDSQLLYRLQCNEQPIWPPSWKSHLHYVGHFSKIITELSRVGFRVRPLVFSPVIGLFSETILKDEVLTELCRHVFLILPSKNEPSIYLLRRPISIQLDKAGHLHSGEGPALEFGCGFRIYALHGVWTKAKYFYKNYSIKGILTETNVDMRRELIRKVGIQSFVSAGVVLDEWGDYKLIDMINVLEGNTTHSTFRHAPFLMMKNPSLPDTYHLEAVSPRCTTCEEAISWRAGNITTKWEPWALS